MQPCQPDCHGTLGLERVRGRCGSAQKGEGRRGSVQKGEGRRGSVQTGEGSGGSVLKKLYQQEDLGGDAICLETNDPRTPQLHMLKHISHYLMKSSLLRPCIFFPLFPLLVSVSPFLCFSVFHTVYLFFPLSFHHSVLLSLCLSSPLSFCPLAFLSLSLVLCVSFWLCASSLSTVCVCYMINSTCIIQLFPLYVYLCLSHN